MDSTALARTLGAVLRSAPVGDPFEYRYMFDLTANTFLQKLIPKRLLDRKLDLAPAGFFKSLLIMDFYTNAVRGDERLLDNLKVIEGQLGSGPARRALTTELIVLEVGLCEKESATSRSDVEGRWREGAPCPLDPASLDAYYEGMGFLLLDQLDHRPAAARVACAAHYQAAVFAGALAARMGPAGEPVRALLESGRFLDATLDALAGLAASVRLEDLSSELAPPGR